MVLMAFMEHETMVTKGCRVLYRSRSCSDEHDGYFE